MVKINKIKPVEKIKFKKGDKVWSDYFRDWLIIVQINSDKDWYFVPLKNLDKLKFKAHTALSFWNKNKV